MLRAAARACQRSAQLAGARPALTGAQSSPAAARRLSSGAESDGPSDIDPNLVLYKVLGVPKSADPALIKQAYLKKAALWHPDRNESTIDLARRKFDEVKIALDILSDDTLRNQYDLKKFKHVVDILKNKPRETRGGY